jgi:hypothetical protein
MPCNADITQLTRLGTLRVNSGTKLERLSSYVRLQYPVYPELRDLDTPDGLSFDYGPAIARLRRAQGAAGAC